MGNEVRVKAAIVRATAALSSSEKVQNFFDQDCQNDTKGRNVHRGMMLAYAGYYLVMTDLRTGSYQEYDMLPDDHGLLQKGGLFSFWSIDRALNVWRATNALKTLAPDDKRAIAAFLTELKSFRPIYTAINSTKPNYDLLQPDEASAILRRAGRSGLDECLSSGLGYELKWTATPRGGTSMSGAPVIYMIGFWHRRDLEGKSDLAELFLGRMIELLSRN
jgi:hypothetical protein